MMVIVDFVYLGGFKRDTLRYNSEVFLPSWIDFIIWDGNVRRNYIPVGGIFTKTE
jgi:hypothetical protein